MDWLPGVLQLPATQEGGAQVMSYPPRLVLHTTEGSGTVQSLASFYRSSTYWPHFTADLFRKQIAQHIPLSRGARALSHTTATETNNANCIQVEIIGRASEAASWPADQVDWLGRALAPAMDALGIQRSGPAFVGGGAGLHAAQRMSETAWRAFNGVCGHQHVPENDHWDPGAFDLARFLAATHSEVDPPMTDAEMTKLLDRMENRIFAPDPHHPGQHVGLLAEALKVYLYDEKFMANLASAIAAHIK